MRSLNANFSFKMKTLVALIGCLFVFVGCPNSQKTKVVKKKLEDSVATEEEGETYYEKSERRRKELNEALQKLRRAEKSLARVKDYKSLKVDFEKSVEEKSALRQQLRAAETQLEKYKMVSKNSSEVDKKNSELERKIELIKASLEEKETLLDEALTENEVLRNEAKEARERLNARLADLQRVSSEVDKVGHQGLVPQSEVEEIRSELIALRERAERAENQLSQSIDERNMTERDSRQKIENANREISNLNSVIGNLNEDLERIKKKKAEAEHVQAEGEVFSGSQENLQIIARQKEQLAKAESEIEQLGGQIESSQAELTNERAARAQQQLVLVDTQEKVNQLNALIEKEKASQNQTSSLRKIEELSEKLKVAESRIIELQDAAESTNSFEYSTDFSMASNDLNNEVSKLSQEVTQLRSENAEQRNEAERFKRLFEEASENLRESKARESELSEAYHAVYSVKTELENEITQYEESLSQVRREYEQIKSAMAVDKFQSSEVTEVASGEKDDESMIEELRQKNQLLQELSEKLKRISAGKGELERINEKLVNEKNELHRIISELRENKSNSEGKSNRDHANERVTALQNRVTLLEAESQKLSVQSDGASERNKELVLKNQVLRKELEDSMAKVQELTLTNSESQNLAAKYSLLRSQSESDRKTILELREELDQLRSLDLDKAEVVDERDQLIKEKTRLKESIKEFERLLENSEFEFNELKKELEIIRKRSLEIQQAWRRHLNYKDEFQKIYKKLQAEPNPKVIAESNEKAPYFLAIVGEHSEEKNNEVLEYIDGEPDSENPELLYEVNLDIPPIRSEEKFERVLRAVVDAKPLDLQEKLDDIFSVTPEMISNPKKKSEVENTLSARYTIQKIKSLSIFYYMTIEFDSPWTVQHLVSDPKSHEIGPQLLGASMNLDIGEDFGEYDVEDPFFLLDYLGVEGRKEGLCKTVDIDCLRIFHELAAAGDKNFELTKFKMKDGKFVSAFDLLGIVAKRSLEFIDEKKFRIKNIKLEARVWHTQHGRIQKDMVDRRLRFDQIEKVPIESIPFYLDLGEYRLSLLPVKPKVIELDPESYEASEKSSPEWLDFLRDLEVNFSPLQ